MKKFNTEVEVDSQEGISAKIAVHLFRKNSSTDDSGNPAVLLSFHPITSTPVMTEADAVTPEAQQALNQAQQAGAKLQTIDGNVHQLVGKQIDILVTESDLDSRTMNESCPMGMVCYLNELYYTIFLEKLDAGDVKCFKLTSADLEVEPV